MSRLKDSGVVIARYSIFFGGPSTYTGRTAEEAGFSLDIPKDVATVEKLLTNDSFLDGIAQRDEGLVKEGLREINSELEREIIATPFLSQALATPLRSGREIWLPHL